MKNFVFFFFLAFCLPIPKPPKLPSLPLPAIAALGIIASLGLIYGDGYLTDIKTSQKAVHSAISALKISDIKKFRLNTKQTIYILNDFIVIKGKDVEIHQKFFGAFENDKFVVSDGKVYRKLEAKQVTLKEEEIKRLQERYNEKVAPYAGFPIKKVRIGNESLFFSAGQAWPFMKVTHPNRKPIGYEIINGKVIYKVLLRRQKISSSELTNLKEKIGK